MNKAFIPLSVPNLKGNELHYVTKAVETEWVSTGGPYVKEFENKVAEYVHAKGAVSCQNGTSGLHIALLITGVTPDDAVLVPTLTFIAAINPVKYIGASPIFMDCDDSLSMDPVKLERFCREQCTFDGEILRENKSGKRIRVVLVVHVFGNMADMVTILGIARSYHLKVVEDATEAIGTHYTFGELAGKYAGTMGDVGVYSFNGNKIITTGGGGMIVSNQEALLSRAKHLTTQAKADELCYIHDEIGYNYRMTNLQAALGLGQLEQLEYFISIKEQNYRLYCKLLEGNERYSILPFRSDIRSNHWFYSLFCHSGIKDRDSLIPYFAEHKIQTRPIWGLIHTQKPYQGADSYQIDKATYYWEHVVNVPCSTNLTEDEVRRVILVLQAR